MISVVYKSRLYRELLDKTVKQGDVVIEIGPHVGSATKRYCARAGLTVAIDKGAQSEEAFQKMQEKNANLFFFRDDARSFDAVQRVLEKTQRCDVLAVDMGGGRFADTVFKVWAVWSGVFRPRHSIIRNRSIAEFVQKAKVGDPTVIMDFPDDGWLSTWGRTVPTRLKDQLGEFSFWVDPASMDPFREKKK
jgi:hypothetical protein